MKALFGWAIVVLAVLWFFDERVEGMFTAKDRPLKIYVIEEDHTSISGQLQQAERLFELYFENGVRDIVVEGYTGDLVPLRQLPFWLPAIVHDAAVDYAFSGHRLANFMPAVVPRNEHHRLSITLPELVAGNLTAAELLAAMLPVRLHPGESAETYDRNREFKSAMCVMLAKSIAHKARYEIDASNRSLVEAYNRAYDSAVGVNDMAGRLSATAQMRFVRELLPLLNHVRGNGSAASLAWAEVCDDRPLQSIISIERMQQHYDATRSFIGITGSGQDDFTKDQDFLKARAEASVLMAQRSGHLARRLGRSVAVIVGAAHTERVRNEIDRQPGMQAVVVSMSNTFGRLGSKRLERNQWLQRERRERTSAADYAIFTRMRPMRRAPPVVRENWFQARCEMASIADRLLNAALIYQSDASMSTAGAGEIKGRFVAVDTSTRSELSSRSERAPPGSELSGVLVRASVRFEVMTEDLWLAARQSGYVLADDARVSSLTLASVRKLFAWLRELDDGAMSRWFGAVSEARAGSGGSVPVLVRLSLGVRAAVAHARERAMMGFAYLR